MAIETVCDQTAAHVERAHRAQRAPFFEELKLLHAQLTGGNLKSGDSAASEQTLIIKPRSR
eukprot:7377399-Prymnesium_polylepis.2